MNTSTTSALPPVSAPDGPESSGRRDFLYIATTSVGVVGAGLAMWPFIDNMNPAADVLAISKIELSLKPIELGQRITVKWRGSPVFIVRRTPEQIAAAQIDDNNFDLIDPATDASRAQQAQWLVVIGVCTHLGCIPLGQRDNEERGKWQGWFCPCHGSIYDIAGRVRRGPAPRNLDLPPYKFGPNQDIFIG